MLDTWAAAWGPPGTRTCPWGAQVSCPWGCHGPALSQRRCETCGCKAHPADRAAGDTLVLSTGSLWLLACLSRDGRWCPLLLPGTCCVTRFGCVGNKARHFGQGGERMTRGLVYSHAVGFSGAPLPPWSCCHCCPGAPQAWQGLQSPWGAASPQGVIPVLACPNELTRLC